MFLSGSIFGIASEPENIFVVSNLQVNPTTLVLGDSCVATVDLLNTGNVEDNYSLNLTVRNTPFLESDEVEIIQYVLKLKASEEKTVSFFFTPAEIGSYEVMVEELMVQITVIEETENPRISGLDPSSARRGDDLYVTITGSLLDEPSLVEFSMGESILPVIEIHEYHEDSVKVKIEVPLDALTGPYDVTVVTPKGSSTMSWCFLVLDRAEYTFKNLVVNKTSVSLGEEVSVSVDVENISEVEGNESVTLLLDGENMGDTELMLEPGETKKISFNLKIEEPGEHTVAIGNQSEILTANEADEYKRNFIDSTGVAVVITLVLLIVFIFVARSRFLAR
jgi:uncharacterized membrane protein